MPASSPLPRAIAATLLLAALAPPARAEPTDAQRHFERGRALLADGKIAEACDAFSASDAAEPRIGTLLNLGECREQNERLASAWDAFRRAAALAQRTPDEHVRADEARRRAAYLQPRLSYLTITVPAAAGGLAITRDGTPVDRAYWNQEVAVDGGTYTIEARVPGERAWRTEISVPPESGHVVAALPRPHRDDPPPAFAAPIAAPSRFTRLRIGGLALGTAGLVTVGGATVLAIAGARDFDAAWARCPTSPCADDEAARLVDRGTSRTELSHVLFAAGGVAVAGAVTLWILGRPAPHGARVVPTVGADGAGVSLHLEL